MATVDLDEAIERLRDTRDALADPTPFYSANKPAWLELAKTTVVQLLGPNVPDGTEPQRWAETVAEIAEAVSGALFETHELTGLTIFAVIGGALPQGEGYRAVVDYETIVRWVEAGRRGDPLGKHLREIDDGLTDRAIAWRVFHALRVKTGGNIDRLKLAILSFASAQGVGDMGSWLDAVEKAWLEIFTVRVETDWKSWVTTQLARLK